MRRTAGWLGSAVAFFGTAGLACGASLVVEKVLWGHDTAVWASLPYLFRLSFHFAALAMLAVMLFHAALVLTRLKRRWALWGFLLLLGAAAVMPSYALGDFLTSGAWISKQKYRDVLKYGLLVSFVAAWYLLWAWHVWGVNADLRITVRERSARRFWVVDCSWWITGLALPAVVSYFARGQLRTYQLLITYLLFPCWLAVSTVVFRALQSRRTRLRLTHVTGGLGLVSALAAYLVLWFADPDHRIAKHRPRGLGALAANMALELYPVKSLNEHGFDWSDITGYRCPTRSPSLPPLELTEEQRRNVIMLSIDTLRRDAIDATYGGRRVAPHMVRFARQSLFFENAIAAAPGTLYSIGSALTGRSMGQLIYSAFLPINIFGMTRDLFDRQVTVFPIARSFRRSAFRSLLYEGTAHHRMRRSSSMTRFFIEQLERARASRHRVFLWLHLTDPHKKYKIHRRFNFGRDTVQRYHSEVAYDDMLMGKVLKYLRQNGYFQDSLILLFSDHGESLGEDGFLGHGISNHARFIDVPLMVYHPGIRARAITEIVNLTDLTPTILHFLGMQVPANMAGSSLLVSEKALRERPYRVSGVNGIGSRPMARFLKRPVASVRDLQRRQKLIMGRKLKKRFPPEFAVVTSQYRLIYKIQSGLVELYDRNADPAEQNNLAGQLPGVVHRLERAYRQWRTEEARRIYCQLGEPRSRRARFSFRYVLRNPIRD